MIFEVKLKFIMKVFLERINNDYLFEVKNKNGHKVLCYTAGKLKKFKIRMLVGDKVTVEMTPYDLTKGRITFRGKKRP